MNYLLAALLLAATSGPPRISEMVMTDSHGTSFAIPAGNGPYVSLIAGVQRVFTLSIDGAGQPQLLDAQGFRLASFSVVKGRLEVILYRSDGKEGARVSSEMPGRE